MTSKERILAALRHKKPDRIPWAPLIDDYFTSSLPENMAMNVVETLRYIGADIMERHVPTFTSLIPRVNGVTSKPENPVIQDKIQLTITKQMGDIKLTAQTDKKRGEVLHIYETPLGILKERSIFTKTSPFIPFPIEYKIKKRGDLKIYKYFIENLKYEPYFNEFQKEADYIGDDGLATTSGPCTPLLTLLQIDMGLERFYYYLSDYPQEMEKLLTIMQERNKEIYRIIAKSPAEVVIDYENTSTTLHSPKIYERYCLGQLNEYADILHKENKIFLIHRCGKLKNLMDLIDKGEEDGTIDVTPRPTGDLNMAEALKAWGKSKVVMGGIDPTAFTGLSSEKIKEYVKKLLKEVSPGDNFILGSADATPFGTSIENLKAITQVVKEYGEPRPFAPQGRRD